MPPSYTSIAPATRTAAFAAGAAAARGVFRRVMSGNRGSTNERGVSLRHVLETSFPGRPATLPPFCPLSDRSAQGCGRRASPSSAARTGSPRDDFVVLCCDDAVYLARYSQWPRLSRTSMIPLSSRSDRGVPVDNAS
ncbi:hypothetical protein MRX96_035249 [Rhipicephalus microplus]